MPTLTETAYYSRKAVKFGSIGIVVLLVLRFAFITIQAAWKKAHPPAPPPPTVTFGKLPKLDFPERQNLPTFTFKLETISGSLPDLSTQAKVFFIPQPSPNFSTKENTKNWAKKLGFIKEPLETDQYFFKFSTDTVPRNTLEVDCLTRNFQLSYDWKNDLEILSKGSPPYDAQAVSTAKSFLQGAEVLTKDLMEGSSEIIYLKYLDGNLVNSIYNESVFARVNLFRKKLEELKILSPNPKEANVSLLVSSSSNNKGIIEAKYYHYPISENNFSTYPLKDSKTAWSALIGGKGFIANPGNNPEGKIIIRNAYLAYYESEQPQTYLQPIIVFEGDNDFFGYVPAVTENWVVE